MQYWNPKDSLTQIARFKDTFGLNKRKLAIAAATVGVFLIAAVVFMLRSSEKPNSATTEEVVTDNAPRISLKESQLATVKVESVRELEFPIEKQAVGTITFNEEMSVQVFTPYAGRIIGTFAHLGDDVKRGETLFTIDSPDLLQAETTLISSAGTLEVTTRNLARQKELVVIKAVSQKDLEQAMADQQAAEAAYRAARDAMRLFGKSETEIDNIIAKRSADSVLIVPSPISGRITMRNAAPGL